MDNYITQYQAAKLMGISPARVTILIRRGKFIEGKMVYNKHCAKKIMQFKLEDVLEYSKNNPKQGFTKFFENKRKLKNYFGNL
jgi:hypothetical protein